jgi:hypothetical protein
MLMAPAYIAFNQLQHVLQLTYYCLDSIGTLALTIYLHEN